jgi:hypothetical protein
MASSHGGSGSIERFDLPQLDEVIQCQPNEKARYSLQVAGLVKTPVRDL